MRASSLLSPRLLALSASLTLLGCPAPSSTDGGTGGGGDDGGGAAVDAGRSLTFTEVAYPTTDAEKRLVKASPSVQLDGVSHSLAFHPILRSGQTSGAGVFGRLYMADGGVLKATDGSERISDDNEHTTLLDVHAKLFMVSQFESRPGGFYLTELSQSATTGELTAVSTKPIDFSTVGGGWVHCAGMRSPWKSHVGSEEYEPDARLVDPITGVKALPSGATLADGGVSPDTYYGAMGDYFGGDMTKVNPYRYGYTVEVKVTSGDLGTGPFASNVTVEKHFAMGRLAFELAYIMPDQRTAYLTDDGSMVGLFRFKADAAATLTAGSLYAAKLTQTSAEHGGSFAISWVDLGHATDAEIAAFIGSGVTFADLFEAVAPTKDAAGAFSCPAGSTGVSAGHDFKPGHDGKTYHECLTLKTSNTKGMTAAQIEQAASRLETRRYAALKGATLELQKEEGITFDPARKKLFLAMSDVTLGMLENSTGAKSTTEAFSRDEIRVPQNRCGVVYELDVDDAYVANAMRGLVEGSPADYDSTSRYAGNTCHVTGIANPDNVTFLPSFDTLIIGEDTSRHQNDLIWAYHLGTKTLTRIQTTPYGSETTSPYFYPNINGWGYLMSVVQHPYGESDTDKVDAASAERRAYTGYVGPFPRLD